MLSSMFLAGSNEANIRYARQMCESKEYEWIRLRYLRNAQSAHSFQLHRRVNKPAIRGSYCEEAYVHDEGDVSDGHLAAHEPLLLGKHALENSQDTKNLFLVPLDRARYLLRVEPPEPSELAVVGSGEW